MLKNQATRHRQPSSKNASHEIFLERVDGEASQIDVLYDLLKNRIYNISHEAMPTLEQHTDFVLSEPYRAWFLVFIDDQPIGSVYLQDDNSIGMNLAEQSLPLVDACLRFVFDNFQPMQGKLSRVRKDFHINVPNENNELKSILSELDLAPVQVTYVIQALKG